MSEIDTGGMAFPTEHIYNQHGIESRYSEKGMTLLDYFAANALIGLLNPGWECNSADAPKIAYELAKEMLAEKRRIEAKREEK